MRRATLLLFAGLLGSTASAQRAPGAERDEARYDFTRKQVRETLFDYGRCVVARPRDRAAVASAILSSLDNAELRRRIGGYETSDCLIKAARSLGSTELRMPGDTGRHVMADALVVAELPGTVLRDLDAVEPLEHRQFDAAQFAPEPGEKSGKRRQAEREQARAEAYALSLFSRFGECVVRHTPDKVHALLMARPETPAEARAFATLTPELGNCLEKGSRFTINRMTLRGTLALNYYRLAKAPRTSAAAGVTQ